MRSYSERRSAHRRIRGLEVFGLAEPTERVVVAVDGDESMANVDSEYLDCRHDSEKLLLHGTVVPLPGQQLARVDDGFRNLILVLCEHG